MINEIYSTNTSRELIETISPKERIGENNVIEEKSDKISFLERFWINPNYEGA